MCVFVCVSLQDFFNTFCMQGVQMSVLYVYEGVYMQCVWGVYGSMQSFCLLMWVCASLFPSVCKSVCQWVVGVGGHVYSQCKWKSRLKHLLSNYPAKSQNQAFVKRLCTHSRRGLCVRMCVLNSFTCEVSASVCSFAGSLKKILVDFIPKRSHWLISHTLELLLRYPFAPLHSDRVAKISQNTQLPHIQ